jgi:predicted regulator of Ras-like GTPase activity (Roadblock/LC7/MglB family)
MPDTKKDGLVKILQELRKIGNVLGSSVISTDGLPIASDLGADVDEDTFAAMSAAMQGAADTAVSELKQGELKQIIVEAERGKMISTAAGENAILVILAKPGINLGLILLEIKKASGKIADLLGG